MVCTRLYSAYTPQMPTVRLLVRIGILPRFAVGEGRESHDVYCHGSFKLLAVPTALTGVAQLKDAVLSIPAAGSFVLSHTPGMAARVVNLVYPRMFLRYRPFNRA
jgi:hypothetical protein